MRAEGHRVQIIAAAETGTATRVCTFSAIADAAVQLFAARSSSETEESGQYALQAPSSPDVIPIR